MRHATVSRSPVLHSARIPGRSDAPETDLQPIMTQ